MAFLPAGKGRARVSVLFSAAGRSSCHQPQNCESLGDDDDGFPRFYALRVHLPPQLSPPPHRPPWQTLDLMQISHENESEHDIDIEIVGVGLASEDWDFRSFPTGTGPNPADPAEVGYQFWMRGPRFLCIFVDDICICSGLGRRVPAAGRGSGPGAPRRGFCLHCGVFFAKRGDVGASSGDSVFCFF